MKNRRKVIALFIVCAVLSLGIGYASLSDALFIHGSATAEYEDVQRRFDENIYFFDAIIENEHQHCAAGCEARLTTDPDVAEMNVAGFGAAGDSVQAVFIINNDNTDVAAEIALPNILIDGAATNPYFLVTTDWTGPKTVNAGGNVTIKVTVTLLRTPTHLALGETMTTNFTIQLNATAVTN